MTSQDRVLAACQFRAPDRIPRFENFWQYPKSWEERLGPADGLTDLRIWAGDETPFPSRARILREEADWVYRIDGWGRTLRGRKDAYFTETLQVPIPSGTDPDTVQFESPETDRRYLAGQPDTATMQAARASAKAKHCILAKTGGPYLRTTFVRGEEQFLLDIASDPPLAKALADKVADHITRVGIEEIRRWSLQQTGIGIYDDMAYNEGPMFSPKSFETIFLPAYRRMIRAYKNAGAPFVYLHSDGCVLPLLDMLIDAGIDGLHPLERRAGMDVAMLRRKYPRLVLIGGMCNTDTLVHGPAAKVEAEARQIIDLGRQGGVIIGTHSVSPEIPLELYEAYNRTCLAYGAFSR